MTKSRARTRSSRIEKVVGAPGPHPEHRDALMLFGQFVGSWDVESHQRLPDGTERILRREWHFYWASRGGRSKT